MFKIVIDVNLWISLLIGKKLKTLRKLCLNKKVTLISSSKIVEEYLDVSARLKVRKYVTEEEVLDVFDLIKAYCVDDPAIDIDVPSLRDPDDLYLLALADVTGANFLLTGDKDLLVLGKYNQTKIISYSKFMAIFEE